MIAIYSYVALQVLRLLQCVASVAVRCRVLHRVALGVQRAGATGSIGVQQVQRGATVIFPRKMRGNESSAQVARGLHSRARARKKYSSLSSIALTDKEGCNAHDAPPPTKAGAGHER
jgi:hypothetical protein